MVDLHSIIENHKARNQNIEAGDSQHPKNHESDSIDDLVEIPALFFDRILVDYKLNRIEIMTLMYLYRKVWCGPNLYRIYGISQLMSHTEVAKHLHCSIDDIYHSLRKLEDLGFISTVRSGQYFVRKYFQKEWDEYVGITYDDFEV